MSTKTKALPSDSEEHPSFGLIGLSRYTVTPPERLFGSSILSSHGIHLTISQAKRIRSLANEWHHATDEVIRVNLSAAQFADMITNLNIGDGVPCTITGLNGKPIKPLNDVESSPRVRIMEDFDNKMVELGKQMETLEKLAHELHDSPSVTKGARLELLKQVQYTRCNITNNIPYIHAQFNEAMDDTLSQAKAELATFRDQALKGLGEEKLKQLAQTAQPVMLLEAKGAPE